MPKLLKLTLEKSRTVEDGRGWRKAIVTLSADISDVENETKLDQYYKNFSDKLDDLLAKEFVATPAATDKESQVEQPEPPIDVDNIPDIDIAELNEAPWQTYKKKPARPDQTAWVKNPVEFVSWQDPPKVLAQLVKALRLSPNQELVLGDKIYSFGGKGDMKDHFISRKPYKPEKATEPRKPKPKASNRLEDMKALFSKKLEDLLTFTEKDGVITIKPRQYLGSEDFAKIASVVRGVNGEYISDGKASHFRIPKNH